MSAGERRLFRSVTQPLLWLHFRLLFKCHSKVKLIQWLSFCVQFFCNNYKSLKIASILTFPGGCLPSDYILPTIGNSFRLAVKHHR